jgi:LysR family glycine cleavage system transcriptional activator
MHRLRAFVPSANYLFAFEAAARRRSFTAAARELNVTQPAVSKTIRLLEDSA